MSENFVYQHARNKIILFMFENLRKALYKAIDVIQFYHLHEYLHECHIDIEINAESSQCITLWTNQFKLTFRLVMYDYE